MSTTTETPAQRRRRIKKAGTHQARVDRQTNLIEPTEPTEPTEQPNRFATKYALDILSGLQHRHVYGGTVADAVKQQRRIKARAAGKARRAGRAS